MRHQGDRCLPALGVVDSRGRGRAVHVRAAGPPRRRGCGAPRTPARRGWRSPDDAPGVAADDGAAGLHRAGSTVTGLLPAVPAGMSTPTSVRSSPPVASTSAAHTRRPHLLGDGHRLTGPTAAKPAPRIHGWVDHPDPRRRRRGRVLSAARRVWRRSLPDSRDPWVTAGSPGDEVDRFGATPAEAGPGRVVIEGGRHLGPPRPQRPTPPSDLRDGAAVGGGEHPLGGGPSRSRERRGTPSADPRRRGRRRSSSGEGHRPAARPRAGRGRDQRGSPSPWSAGGGPRPPRCRRAR